MDSRAIYINKYIIIDLNHTYIQNYVRLGNEINKSKEFGNPGCELYYKC